MTVIWPRLRACFRTPSHYKSGRQECDWVSRPVSPLRSFLPSPPSFCPTTPFLPSPLLPHPFLMPSALPLPRCSMFLSSFSPLFYLLPIFSLLPELLLFSLHHYRPFLSHHPFPGFIHPPILLLYPFPTKLAWQVSSIFSGFWLLSLWQLSGIPFCFFWVFSCVMFDITNAEENRVRNS